MRTHTQWARVVIASGALTASIAACDSVLDIEDPKMRPAEAGEAGQPSTGATDSGGSSSGAGGTHGNTTPRGGAGQAGEAPTGGTEAGAGGEGGTPAMKDCQTGTPQCGGTDGKTPQICDETGHWVTNTEEANSDCPVLCAAGKCTECVDDAKRCTVCEDGDNDCDTNLPQTCVAGVWTNDKKSCAQFCSGDGVCATAPSCDALNADRTTCKDGVSCCKSFLVPGGSYTRFDEDSDVALPTTVDPFLLDKFEVTVGRMRQFASAYAEVLTTTLKEGAGKSDHILADSGWNSDFVMPVDKAALTADLKSCAGATWSDDLLTNNDMPVNCVSFNVAYAFCIWDGGRLPTEAEWQFAAAGGDQKRLYPWEGPDITHEYANYTDIGDDALGSLPVGSKPLGDGRWGQSDLAGNLGEWTLDYFHLEYPTSCTNCLNTTVSGERAQRGGAYAMPGDALWVSAHIPLQPTLLRSYSGFRCARDSK